MSHATLRTTPLHEAHVGGGARMVDFAGWHMPVQYSGVVDEHLAVRQRAGLFDVSHMGEARVRGPQALDLLQRLTCNDVARLQPGRVQYTAMTTAAGGFVDDLLIYQLASDDYLLVINAANTPKDVAWLQQHAPGFDAQVEDVSDRWAQIALQGPKAVEILEPLVAEPVAGLRYYSFIQTRIGGVAGLVSRTGYTGEDGFEIYLAPEAALTLWCALLAGGERQGLVPVGLGARDTLRLEARLLLYGNDMDESTSVIEADLGWIVKPNKGEFLGRSVLTRQMAEGTVRRLVGFELKGRGIAREHHTVHRGGQTIGRVTSGTFAPFLRRSIGLAYVSTEHADVGTECELEIRGRREAAMIVATPFYKRSC